jgi:FkbM family methyltransferase
MSQQGTKLSKVIQSVIMTPVNSLKNRFLRADNQKGQYNRFHSQFGEDRYIFENLELPHQGVFVDVGAGHPIYLSNTYFFEKNGWEGICIDADPSQYELLKKERNQVQWAAISAEEGEIEFSQSYLPSYSSAVNEKEYNPLLKVPFKGIIKVPAFRLETILQKYNIEKIDLLDIDVEGTELEVWQTLDYEKHKPTVVILEYQTFGLSDNLEKIQDFFSTLPYKIIHKTCTNLIFLHC